MVGEVAREHKLALIEDCCLALGAGWRGQKLGGFGVAGVFSFGFAKPLQAGEGGMIVTDDAEFARECEILRSRGGLWTFTGEKDVRTLGWNGRISAFVSAVALAQLRKYPELLARMQVNARPIEDAVRACKGLALFREDPRITAQGYTQLGFRVLPETLGIPRALFCEALRAEGVPASAGSFMPTQRYTFFKGGEWKRWLLRCDDPATVEANYSRPYPNADRLFDHEAVYLPRHLLLREPDARAAAAAIQKVCSNIGPLQRLHASRRLS